LFGQEYGRFLKKAPQKLLLLRQQEAIAVKE